MVYTIYLVHSKKSKKFSRFDVTGDRTRNRKEPDWNLIDALINWAIQQVLIWGNVFLVNIYTSASFYKFVPLALALDSPI